MIKMPNDQKSKLENREIAGGKKSSWSPENGGREVAGEWRSRGHRRKEVVWSSAEGGREVRKRKCSTGFDRTNFEDFVLKKIF